MEVSEVIYQLGQVDLVIPAWQMALYIGIISIFMLIRQTKLFILSTYLAILYLAFFFYWPEFIGIARSSGLVLSLYLICGMLTVALGIVALFQEEP